MPKYQRISFLNDHQHVVAPILITLRDPRTSAGDIGLRNQGICAFCKKWIIFLSSWRRFSFTYRCSPCTTGYVLSLSLYFGQFCGVTRQYIYSSQFCFFDFEKSTKTQKVDNLNWFSSVSLWSLLLELTMLFCIQWWSVG